MYKRKVRENRTEAEVEYDKIEGLLLMRKKRQNHDGKQHLLENLAAKQGMRTLRKYGCTKGREELQETKMRKISGVASGRKGPCIKIYYQRKDQTWLQR